MRLKFKHTQVNFGLNKTKQVGLQAIFEFTRYIFKTFPCVYTLIHAFLILKSLFSCDSSGTSFSKQMIKISDVTSQNMHALTRIVVICLRLRL